MDVMALLSVGGPLATPLLVAVGRWLVLRARADLVRAAAELPAGIEVSGHDIAGQWTARRAVAPELGEEQR